MEEIMKLIFQYYGFDEMWKSENQSLRFYKNSNPQIVSYFWANYIDCQEIEDEEKLFKNELMNLEQSYIELPNSERGLKWILQSIFVDRQEASQLDKNTSAIYLLKFSDLKKMEQFRNLIYSIEESPNYFKRYILPYSEEQVNELLTIIKDYKDKNILEILSDLANNEDEYYTLLEHKNTNRVYELVIRLFSKIPFLQYVFKAEPTPLSLEKNIENKLDDNLKKYHGAIENENIDLEQLIGLEEDFDISDEDLESMIIKLIGDEA